jgi:hypothetical protein
VPRFLHGACGGLRPSYTRGRAALLASADRQRRRTGSARDFYGRTHPALSSRLRWDVVGDVFVELGAAYTENWFARPAEHARHRHEHGAPAVRALLSTATRHGVLLGETR